MENRRSLFILLASAVMSAVTPHVAAQPPPSNDDYENRAEIIGRSTIFAGTTVGATAQPNEMAPQNEGYPGYYTFPTTTVWFTWTAPSSGEVSIDLMDSSDDRSRQFSSWIAVWHDVDWPNRTGQSEYGMRLDIPGHPRLHFVATEGVAYDLQVCAQPYGSFHLRLTQTNTPVILVPPQQRLVSLGGSTFLGVVANGAEPYMYQWRFNGADIAGETYPTLSLDHVDPNMAGSYSVIVSNGTSSIESPAGVLTIRTNDLQPTLICNRPQDGAIACNIVGEPLTYYRIQSSTNLTDWVAENTFPLPLPYLGYTSLVFNNGPQSTFFAPIAGNQKFLRAIRYAPDFSKGEASTDSEICVNNLRKIRFAKELWGSQTGTQWSFVETVNTPLNSMLRAYIPELYCPLDVEETFDTSYRINMMVEFPACKIEVSHVLEEPSELR